MNLSDVQDRSERVFAELLRQSGQGPERGLARPQTSAAAAPAPEVDRARLPVRFSVFDPAQAAAASELALGLSVLAAASSDLVEGLDAVLTRASQAAQTDDPELVHHALSLFVTHSREGRRLVKPRTVAAEPRKFPPSALAAEGGPAALEAVAAGSTGTERPLDFWREDPLANEHHEHWHEVYPFSGLFPSDWRAWAASADRQGVRELLERLDPAPDWEAFLTSADADAIADTFLALDNAAGRKLSIRRT